MAATAAIQGKSPVHELNLKLYMSTNPVEYKGIEDKESPILSATLNSFRDIDIEESCIIDKKTNSALLTFYLLLLTFL